MGGTTPAGAGARLAAPAALKPAEAIRESNLQTNPPAGQISPSGMIWRSYYFIGSVRVAVREASGATSVLSYIVTDHLGSTSMMLDVNGVDVSTTLYKPWGDIRYTSGAASMDYKYTGQLQVDIGIYYYGARFTILILTAGSSPIVLYPTLITPLTGIGTRMFEITPSITTIQQVTILARTARSRVFVPPVIQPREQFMFCNN